MANAVCDRVHAIIHAQANLSAAEAATAAAEYQDSATPQVVRDTYRVLSALLKNDAKTGAILRHQIKLCRLVNIWGQVKRLVSDNPLAPEDALFLSRCPPPAQGVNNASRAIAGICNGIGMDKEAFGLYHKNAALPSAHPGLGSWRHTLCEADHLKACHTVQLDTCSSLTENTAQGRKSSWGPRASRSSRSSWKRDAFST